MRHLHVSPPANMHRFVLLLVILGFGQYIYAASVFQFPDLTRRLPERPTSPGCKYKDAVYEHGERVPTVEPCLNCTCNRAIVLCFLRVCSGASAPPAGCFAAREVGECCPTLVCGGVDLSKPSNKSESELDLRPTFQPVRDETTSIDYPTSEEYYTDSSSYDSQSDSSAYDSQSDSSPYDSQSYSSPYDSQSYSSQYNRQTDSSLYDSQTDRSPYDSQTDSSPSNSQTDTTSSYITSNTAEGDSFSKTTQTFETSPTYLQTTIGDHEFHTTLSEGDSFVYITSTQEPLHLHDINVFNDIPGGCLVNGTLYGDGSAMLSSTFCEYCFCIRGKSTCLRPKCHLAIDGCVPQYDNNYSCCPSRYDCSQRYSSNESIKSKNITTTMSTTLAETTNYMGAANCIVNGAVYHEGEVVPDHKSCHNCYCSDSSVICEKIKCSPPLEGCQPIIPEGHCCPISYRCDYSSGHLPSDSIKGSYLNNSAGSGVKGADIKTVKNYDLSDNSEHRIKVSNNKESIALLHNIITAQRRLDGGSHYELNSTQKDKGEESSIHIGDGIAEKLDSDQEIPLDQVRENDKNLNLKVNDSKVTELHLPEGRTSDDITESYYNTSVPHVESSSIKSVSVGSPEVHTLSLKELFDRFFSKQHQNISKIQDPIYAEPKRNNSKQPSSIVEIYDAETDVPFSTTLKAFTTKLLSNEENSELSSEDLTLGTETENPKTDSVTANYIQSKNTADTLFDSVIEHTTDPKNMVSFIEDTESPNQEKIDTSSALNPITEEINIDELQTRTNTESSYPTFISTSIKNEDELQGNPNTFSTSSTITTGKESADSLEVSSSSHIYTTTDELYNSKFNSHTQTPSTHTFTNIKEIHSVKPENTYLTSPVPMPKSTMPEELKSETKTRPLLIIYSTTKDGSSEEAETHSEEQSTDLLYDGITQPFNDEPKTYSEMQTTSWHGTTESSLNDDSLKQTGAQFTSQIYDEKINSNDKVESLEGLYSIFPAYTTARNLNNDDTTEMPSFSTVLSTTTKNNDDSDEIHRTHLQLITTPENINNEGHTETRPSPLHFSTTINMNNEDQTQSQPSKFLIFSTTRKINTESETETSPYPFFSSTTNMNNEDKTESQSSLTHASTARNEIVQDQTKMHPSPFYTSTVSQYNSEFYKETPTPVEYTSHSTYENIDNTFKTQTQLPISTTANNENLKTKTKIHMVFPTSESTHQALEGNQEEVTDIKPTTKLLVTDATEREDLDEDQTKPTTVLYWTTMKKPEQSQFTTVNIPTEETNSQTELVTTENSKMATRINSKLPSFNDVQQTLENNSSIHRNPELTESIVNAYIPSESKDNESKNKSDFTNVGAVYLGAPLAVDETDSQKELDDEQSKITQSGGVIYMDPKYTDLDSETHLEPLETTRLETFSTYSTESNPGEKLDKDSGNNERKKGARIQDTVNQSNVGQGYKIIPFVAQDAIRGQFGKIDPAQIVQPGATEGIPDMVSDFCFVKGRIYMNGETIGKPDPCELCRCFYGRELCQIQRCPTPSDCIPERVPGFCCPRYTCGNNATSSVHLSPEIKPISHVQAPEVYSSTSRRPEIDRHRPTNERPEVKFGIRVRVRPTQGQPIRTPEHTTERRVLFERPTTVKPEIRTLASKPSVATTTSTSQRPHITRPSTSTTPEAVKSTTTAKMETTTTTSTTTTTTPSSLFPDPWGLLKVSGCNIYGKFFNINDQVEILSGPCSHCICTTNGVECNDIC